MGRLAFRRAKVVGGPTGHCGEHGAVGRGASVL